MLLMLIVMLSFVCEVSEYFKTAAKVLHFSGIYKYNSPKNVDFLLF